MKLKKSRVYGPEVSLIRTPTAAVVEKTYRDKILPVRLSGLFLTFWENLIYRRLAGIPGIPTVLPRKDRYSLVTTYMGGENLRETQRKPSSRYFEDLAAIIRAMHGRGVVHLDLRNRRNYGIDPAGNPYLIDFATSLYLPFPAGLRHLLGRIDWMGYTKIKAKLRPDLLTEAEIRRFRKGSRLSSLWLPDRLISRLKKSLKK